MQRKPQQQTLSLRIPAELRNYLERAREVFASHKQEFLSTSDLASSCWSPPLTSAWTIAWKWPISGCAPPRHLAIRCKWEQHRDLSRAEWIFLAQHVQVGCEELADDPELPLPESFAQVLEAFMAVRTLRRERGVELDRYYLGNLGLAGGAALRQRQLDSDLVPRTVAALIRQLRESTPQPKSVFVGRILHVALREESLEDIASVNQYLCPYLPVLYRLAARGHWLRERRPVRADDGGNHFVSRAFPPMLCGDYRLSICVTNAGEAEIVIEMDRKGISYTLGTYPRIREFATLLARLKTGGDWTGAISAGTPTPWLVNRQHASASCIETKVLRFRLLRMTGSPSKIC